MLVFSHLYNLYCPSHLDTCTYIRLPLQVTIVGFNKLVMDYLPIILRVNITSVWASLSFNGFLDFWKSLLNKNEWRGCLQMCLSA